jgi:hypothetical protein
LVFVSPLFYSSFSPLKTQIQNSEDLEESTRIHASCLSRLYEITIFSPAYMPRAHRMKYEVIGETRVRVSDFVKVPG